MTLYRELDPNQTAIKVIHFLNKRLKIGIKTKMTGWLILARRAGEKSAFSSNWPLFCISSGTEKYTR